MEAWLIVAGLAICLALIFRRRFWIAAFGAGSVASCLALMPRIFHLQILSAAGYFILTIIFWKIASAMAASDPLPGGDEKPADEFASRKTDHPDWSPR